MGLPLNFALSALGKELLLSGFKIFEIFDPITSGCGGAGRAGLMSRPGSPTTVRAGCVGRGGSECLAIGSGEDRFTEGGLAVNPLLFVNFNSVMLPLRSLFNDLRLQISDRGEAFAEEAVLEVEYV